MIPENIPNDTKDVFWKKGTCSQTFFYLLNRSFHNTNESLERASDPLAGGLMNRGYQCGMLWGASLGAGAQSYLCCNNCSQAICTAVSTTKNLMESFSKTAHTVNCRQITGIDLTKFSGIAKLGLKTLLGGFKKSVCANLAEAWTSDAINSATHSIAQCQNNLSETPLSCACEVAKKMGASEQEMVTVAGFAGGLGLSGNACGALAAALWINTLSWCKKHPGKTAPYFFNRSWKNILIAFYSNTGSHILCSKICNRNFKTINEHSAFIKSGGCGELISILANY